MFNEFSSKQDVGGGIVLTPFQCNLKHPMLVWKYDLTKPRKICWRTVTDSDTTLLFRAPHHRTRNYRAGTLYTWVSQPIRVGERACIQTRSRSAVSGWSAKPNENQMLLSPQVDVAYPRRYLSSHMAYMHIVSINCPPLNAFIGGNPTPLYSSPSMEGQKPHMQLHDSHCIEWRDSIALQQIRASDQQQPVSAHLSIEPCAQLLWSPLPGRHPRGSRRRHILAR